jgi:hypothetical protein
MILLRKFVIFSGALLSGAYVANSQSAAQRENSRAPCFAIHVHLNGEAIDGPQTVTFKTKETERTAALEGGCLRVPTPTLNEKNVDVFFSVSGNEVYLSAIPTGFLAGPWDIDLEDKRFGRDVVLPKHARTKETCVVVFHIGEPETVRAVTGCRSPSNSGGAPSNH